MNYKHLPFEKRCSEVVSKVDAFISNGDWLGWDNLNIRIPVDEDLHSGLGLVIQGREEYRERFFQVTLYGSFSEKQDGHEIFSACTETDELEDLRGVVFDILKDVYREKKRPALDAQIQSASNRAIQSHSALNTRDVVIEH